MSRKRPSDTAPRRRTPAPASKRAERAVPGAGAGGDASLPPLGGDVSSAADRPQSFAQWRDEFQRHMTNVAQRERDAAASLVAAWRAAPGDLDRLQKWLGAHELTASLLYQVLEEVEHSARSRIQSQRAAGKNEAPRAWVRSEWRKAKAAGDAVSKDSFGRAMSKRLKSEFPDAGAVTAGTIATRWLRGL